ncbi:ABC transporter substrate-binding protein [Desulfospira joergensenii]|uniref:ABC transporter substrate-binding protein n=1 Tax=Desulfospira joergensenii TaxID=53329 RepID=UPI0003B3BC73|nr:ABC transporter substrate-binding protein [Desulfospira joergensenii]
MKTLKYGWAVLMVTGLCLCWLLTPALAGKKDDTLNIAFSKELETLDRYYNTAREGIVVSRHVFDNLLYRDPVTYEYKGLLAKSFNWASNTQLDIELRQGVTFHNSQEMTAEDVAYTLNYAADPASKVKTQRYSDWIDHVEKTGNYSVSIFLKKPFPAALEFLSNANPIYPKAYYSKVGKDEFGVKPIGTGPYKITEVVPGKKIVFEKNADYFKDSPKGQPAIGKIVWRTLPEINTQMAELMTGALDWIYLVPQDQAEKLAMMPSLTVTPAETMRVGFLQFDAVNRSGKEHGMDNPFAKLEVRQAINHAINREAIAKNLIGGQSRAIYSACFPSQFGCDQNIKTYEYDPAKAKALLAKAGYPDGFETELVGYRNRPYAEAMIGDLAAVGIKAKLVMMKYSAMREKARAGKLQMQFLTWGSYSINDISAITSHYFEFEADDLAMDPKVRDSLVEGDSSIDPEHRKAVYSKALKRIADQAYWCPMFTYVSNNCYAKDLNFTPYPDAVPRFFQASWK